MYGIFNPITGQTESAMTPKKGVRRVLRLVKKKYEQQYGRINTVLVSHYTGTKILFDNKRFYRMLDQLIDSHEKGDYKEEMSTIMVDCFYKERADLHDILTEKGLKFEPILTKDVTTQEKRMEYTLIYLHEKYPILILRDSYEGIYDREGFGKRPQIGLSKTEETGEYVPELLQRTFRNNFKTILTQLETSFPDVQLLSTTHTNGGRGGVSCKLLLNDIDAFPHSINPRQALSLIIAKHPLRTPLTQKDRRSARKDAYSLTYHIFSNIPRGYSEAIITTREDWARKYNNYQLTASMRNTKYADRGYGDLERDYGFSKIDLFERLVKGTTVKVKKKSTGKVKYTLSVQKPVIAVGQSVMRSKKIKRIVEGTYGKGERGEVNEKLYRAIDNAVSPLYLSGKLADKLHEGLRSKKRPLHSIAYGLQIFGLQSFMDVTGSNGDALYDSINSIIQVPLEEWGLGGGHMQFTPFKVKTEREEEFKFLIRLFLRPIPLIKHLMIDIGKFYRTIDSIRHAQHELKEIRDNALRFEDPRFLEEIGKTTVAKRANGYIPGYWRSLDFLFKALALYWGKTGRFEDDEVEIEGEARG